MVKTCKHCKESFTPRRKNHVYCSTSCKTLASYKRNGYTYIPGHYVRNEEIVKAEEETKALPAKIIDERIAKFEDKIEQLSINQKKGNVNASSIANAALGTATADAAVYGVKRLFAPQTLPATKQDVENLRREFNDLRMFLNRLYR